MRYVLNCFVIYFVFRDEIFCQICKQLSNNPSKISHARGWILLSLCVGCFPPSEKFVNYLRAFIREGPGLSLFCETRLKRIYANGPRTQPPSWLELQATKTKNPIQLIITLMDGNTRTITVDSATISQEVCTQLCQDLGITDTFGFSLYITLYDKVLSLGSSKEHVLDAISQCEQFAKEQGESERNAPWRLFFRKEIFAPWHNPAEDAKATELIYHQIMRGLKFGEYRCTMEGDVATLGAMQYYVENDGKFDKGELRKNIRRYIPDHFLKAGEKVLGEWEKQIENAFKMTVETRGNVQKNTVQADVVTYGKISWPILFSKFFEAIQEKNKVIIAVNWTGIYVIDDQENILAEVTFIEVLSVEFEMSTVLPVLKIKVIQDDDYVFQTLDAEEIHDLVGFLLRGLKDRSRYAVALKDKESSISTHLPLSRGDLIFLTDSTGADLNTLAWGNGEVNGKRGIFLTEDIHILPVLSPPPQQILAHFSKIPNVKPESSKTSTMSRIKYHTLANYAQDHFRQGRKYVVARGALQSARNLSREEIWRHTNEPIQSPLLQNLQNDETLTKFACLSFMAMLKYMGDLPAVKPKQSNEFTTPIFQPALQHDELRDEIYCQIMRQLTYNRLQTSENCGWELMWLACGLFVPSAGLMKELTEFLKSRTNPISKQCQERLLETLKVGPRCYPPHTIEVDAIKHRSLQIYHKVYFPDDTDEAFEVTSLTKAKDLIEDIVKRLDLKNSDGFSLFVMVESKIFSMPEEYFFFDFIQELLEWVQKKRPNWNCKYFF